MVFSAKMIIECEYQLSEGDIPRIVGCASNFVIDEQIAAISSSFRIIKVTIEIDDEWGFGKIIAVNNCEVIND